MPDRLPRELIFLDRASRALAESTTLDEIKSIRDKAEAARVYAQSAALSLKIQNSAAELKLRAERRAGELLANMSLRGGDRKSISHRESLTLADLGINHNQSARWQLEATVPEQAFEIYIATANKLCRDITAQALLHLARKLVPRPANWKPGGPTGKTTSSKRLRSTRERDDQPDAVAGRADVHDSSFRACEPNDVSTVEIIVALKKQRNLIARILKQLEAGRHVDLKPSERQTLASLISEATHLLHELDRLLLQPS